MSRGPRSAAIAAVAALVLLAVSCRTVGPASAPPSGAIRHSLVFLIHGDADYLFHDDGGAALQADVVALERARAAASANPEAEVFVFHQHGRRGLARGNGTLELYRNAVLAARISYRRGSGGPAAEAGLYRSLSLAPSGGGAQRILLYFGHQLPELQRRRYHASLSRAAVGLQLFADGVAGFLGPGERFDLLVLSTCNNGTPTAVAAFAPSARILIASPADLHLSHMPTAALHHLELRDPPGPRLLAQEMASAAFAELSQRVSTIVTISVYDLDALAPRILEAARVLSARLAGARAPLEPCDCAEDPELAWVAALEGITIHYRPPKFGRERDKGSHSGLECFR